jgi:hypothetical protein
MEFTITTPHQSENLGVQARGIMVHQAPRFELSKRHPSIGISILLSLSLAPATS